MDITSLTLEDISKFCEEKNIEDINIASVLKGALFAHQFYTKQIENAQTPIPISELPTLKKA